MNTAIKALPSFYKNVLFRSRLEARWAYYFDLIGLPWIHEPESFETEYGCYLPDFECLDFYVEVKPNEESFQNVRDKLISFSDHVKKIVFCVIGYPSLRCQWVYFPGTCLNNRNYGDFHAVFCHYAFTYKKWGIPFFGEYENDEDQELAEIASGLRFENGIAQPWRKR